MTDGKKWMQEKREWRDHRERIRKLPKAYRVVYVEIEKYMRKVFCAEGRYDQELLTELLCLFEEGAAAGKEVLEMTGTDVAAFCDDLLEAAAG